MKIIMGFIAIAMISVPWLRPYHTNIALLFSDLRILGILLLLLVTYGLLSGNIYNQSKRK